MPLHHHSQDLNGCCYLYSWRLRHPLVSQAASTVLGIPGVAGMRGRSLGARFPHSRPHPLQRPALRVSAAATRQTKGGRPFAAHKKRRGSPYDLSLLTPSPSPPPGHPPLPRCHHFILPSLTIPFPLVSFPLVSL